MLVALFQGAIDFRRSTTLKFTKWLICVVKKRMGRKASHLRAKAQGWSSNRTLYAYTFERACQQKTTNWQGKDKWKFHHSWKSVLPWCPEDKSHEKSPQCTSKSSQLTNCPVCTLGNSLKSTARSIQFHFFPLWFEISFGGISSPYTAYALVG